MRSGIECFQFTGALTGAYGQFPGINQFIEETGIQCIVHAKVLGQSDRSLKSGRFEAVSQHGGSNSWHGQPELDDTVWRRAFATLLRKRPPRG